MKIGGLNLTEIATTAVDAVARSLAQIALNVGSVGIINYSSPIAGVLDPVFFIFGENREIAAAVSGDYLTAYGACRQHVGIVVNNSDTGTLRITGTSDSSENGVPVVGDTEDVICDGVIAGQAYQSIKKWLQVDSIVVVAGAFTDYDISNLGYYDFGNRLFAINGYRADIRTTSNAGDIRIRFTKISNQGGNKIGIDDFENYGFDSTSGNGEYVDDIRTGAADRSYVMGVSLADSDAQVALKTYDFADYFSSDEYIMDGSNNEGLIVTLEGVPTGGISNIDSINLTVVADANPNL